MALQGTIDAFPLLDVLQLLSASRKTGRLAIDGDRGHGSVWVADGRLVGGEVAGRMPDEPVQLVFEVLRFSAGSFLFEAGADAPEAVFDSQGIPDLLDGARALIEEWATIVEVVPSPAHRVHPVPDLPGEEVSLTPAEWSAVVIAGAGTDMAGLAGQLGLEEFEAARQVCELVARGLLVVEEPAVAPARPNGLVPVDDASAPEVPADPLLADQDGDGDEPFPDRFPIDDLLGEDEHQDDPWSTVDAEARADRFAAAQSFGDEEPSTNGHDDTVTVGEGGFGHAATHPSFTEQGDTEQGYTEQGYTDQGYTDQGYTNPAFAEVPGASMDPAFSDPGPQAFSDPAFSDPAFSEPASHSLSDGARQAFSDPAFSDPAFSDPAFSDPAFAPADAAFTAPPADPAASPAPAAPDGTDEVLRQMSKLSPKAAEAIAAALGTAAETDEPPAEGGSPFLQSF